VSAPSRQPPRLGPGVIERGDQAIDIVAYPDANGRVTDTKAVGAEAQLAGRLFR
jgi:hypothetical protein